MATFDLPVVQQLSTAGDGTGTVEMVGNYSSTATEFSVDGPTAPEDYLYLERILIFVQDTGVFDAEGWANMGTLTNGIDLKVVNAADETLVQLTPAPIKSSGDLAALCHDVVFADYGTGENYATARWTFTKFTPDGLVLNAGEKLVATLHDNMSSLTKQRMTVQGYLQTGNLSTNY